MLTTARTALAIASLAALLAACGGGGDDDDVARSQPSSTAGAPASDGAAPSSEDAPPSTEDASAEPVAPAPALDSPYLQGNGEPDLGPGTEGELSVIAVGAPVEGEDWVPYVVRNGTATTLYDVEATGRLTLDGQLVGTADDQGSAPAVIEPGHIGFGILRFEGEISADATVEATATAETEPNGISPDVPLVMGEANLVGTEEDGQQVVGEASAEDVELSPTVSVLVLCLDDAGAPLSIHQDFADGDAPVPPGGAVTFTVDVEGPCPAFLVAADGTPEA